MTNMCYLILVRRQPFSLYLFKPTKNLKIAAVTPARSPVHQISLHFFHFFHKTHHYTRQMGQMRRPTPQTSTLAVSLEPPCIHWQCSSCSDRQGKGAGDVCVYTLYVRHFLLHLCRLTTTNACWYLVWTDTNAVVLLFFLSRWDDTLLSKGTPTWLSMSSRGSNKEASHWTLLLRCIHRKTSLWALRSSRPRIHLSTPNY